MPTLSGTIQGRGWMANKTLHIPGWGAVTGYDKTGDTELLELKGVLGSGPTHKYLSLLHGLLGNI